MLIHYELGGGSPLDPETVAEHSARALAKEGYKIVEEALLWLVVVPPREAIKALGTNVYRAVYRVMNLLGLTDVFNEGRPFVAFITRFQAYEIDKYLLASDIMTKIDKYNAIIVAQRIKKGDDIVIKWIFRLSKYDYSKIKSWLQYAAEAINDKVYFLLGKPEEDTGPYEIVENFLAAVDRYKNILGKATVNAIRTARQAITYVALDLTSDQSSKIAEVVRRFYNCLLDERLIPDAETRVGAVEPLDTLARVFEVAVKDFIKLSLRIIPLDVIVPIILIGCPPGLPCGYA